MNFEFICVYNPDYGTEENVDPQLVYSTSTETDCIKIIGIAQGIAELSFSFGETPVKWFKTGSKSQSKLVLVVPLLCEDAANWRSGFWFAGQLPLSAETTPPEVAHRLVELAFERHILQSGKPPAASKNESATEYWQKFASAGFLASLPSVVAPDAIKTAAGLLNPTVQRELERSAKQHGALELLITTVSDGSVIYTGTELGFKTRVALQRWLETATPTNYKKGEGVERVETDSRTEAKTETDTQVENEVPLENGAPKDGSSDASSRNEAPEADIASDSLPVADTSAGNVDLSSSPSLKPSKSGSQWLPTAFNFATKMPSFSQLSLNALPSMPTMSMPSMPAMPSFSVSMPSMASVTASMNPLSVSKWWNTSEQDARHIPDGPLVTGHQLFDMETGESFYVTVWRQALYNYTIAFRDQQASQDAVDSPVFSVLARQLEGFSFAFEPPTKFYYMIHDSSRKRVTSTFPPSYMANKDVARCLMRTQKHEQKVVRLGSTWLFFVELENGGVHAVFGKKNLTTQQPTLLGALHSDVQQWLNEYTRKYM